MDSAHVLVLLLKSTVTLIIILFTVFMVMRKDPLGRLQKRHDAAKKILWQGIACRMVDYRSLNILLQLYKIQRNLTLFPPSIAFELLKVYLNYHIQGTSIEHKLVPEVMALFV